MQAKEGSHNERWNMWGATQQEKCVPDINFRVRTSVARGSCTNCIVTYLWQILWRENIKIKIFTQFLALRPEEKLQVAPDSKSPSPAPSERIRGLCVIIWENLHKQTLNLNESKFLTLAVARAYTDDTSTMSPFYLVLFFFCSQYIMTKIWCQKPSLYQTNKVACPLSNQICAEKPDSVCWHWSILKLFYVM